MVKKRPAKRTLKATMEPRLLSEHLGERKYRSPEAAVAELVANAIDADATSVDVQVVANELNLVERIIVSDNGKGITPNEFEQRFMRVAVVSPIGGLPRMGRFGVGRYAAFAIGRRSLWRSVSGKRAGERVELEFALEDEHADSAQVAQSPAMAGEPTGTRIEITALKQDDDLHLVERLRGELLTRFCGRLLAEPSRAISVNGGRLDPEGYVALHTPEVFTVEGLPETATIDHYVLMKSRHAMRLEESVIFAARGMTVATARPEGPVEPNYLGIVTCPVIDERFLDQRETLLDMDPGFNALRDAALRKVADHQATLRSGRRHRFLQRAREKPFYPYPSVANDSLTETKKQLFDLTLELVNEKVNIERMPEAHQKMVFGLLRRAMSSSDALQVLSEVTKLSEDDMAQLRTLLERVTLQSILRMASVVEQRLEFLDLLHELVYGDTAKHIYERSQLHKILEGQVWLFGERFHLATSDKAFRAVIAAHRESAGLPSVSPLTEVKGLSDIPDLYLAMRREYFDGMPTLNLLVELKAPDVPIAVKEIQQGQKYARTLLGSPEIDKTSTQWEVFVVSSRITPEAKLEIKRNGEAKAYDNPEGPQLTVWAFEWSQLIERSRREMQLVSQHLRRTSTEIDLAGKLRERFPEILADDLPAALPIDEEQKAPTPKGPTDSA